MDSMDSDIVILKEMTDRRAVKVIKGSSGSCQQNGIQRKGGVEGSCSGEDEMDEISDFDDAELEVIDCWEENSEGNDVCKSVDEDSEWNDKGLPKSSSDKKLVSVPSSKKVGRTFSFDSDKTVLLKDSSYLVDNKTSQHVSSKVAGTDARATNDLPGKKRSPVPEGYPKAMVSQKASRQSNNAAEDSLTTIKKSSKSDQYSRRPSDLPTDSTEKKVDKFLKEIALQHPTILGLQDAFDDKTSLDSLSSDSSKHSDPELNHVSFINSSDLPPGVDFRQVCEDTTTSGLFGSVLTENKFKRIQSSLDSPYQHSSPVSSKGQYNNVTGPTSSQTHRSACLVTDVLKDSEEGREKRSRSPYADNSLKNYSSRTSRSPPPHKMRRVSHARSFSISPLPSPRSQHPPRSPLPTPRIPSLLDLNYTHVAPVYSDRHSYQPPFLGNSKYHRSRSPIRELSSTRELSRSLSRERSRNHSWSRSRSRSRDRPLGHAHSRSRHRYPSKGNRRYRRSTSRSRSPTYRPRSRSRSHSRSPQRYMSKKSTFRDERDKRLNSSESPSQSSWKPHSEASSNEWHSKYQNINRVLPVKDDVQLEQDMERFIATNMAATGLIPPPALDVRGWFDDDIKSQEHVPLLSNPEMKSPATDLLQGGMPLPPPPPDISELVENVKDTSNLREMSPEVSLSSLLESAVTGCPDKLIIERCQDAIMKLHGVSIKPGRFAVISSIKVPQSELSSTFRPWQSILKRFTALKVNFNCSKPVEQPQFWEMSKSETNQKNISSFQKDSIQVPILSMSTSVQSDPVNCGDMDRAALLDKIFFLNRELQEVRKNLGLESTSYKHVATQTTPASLCKNCIELCSSPHTTNQYQDVVPKIPLSSSSQFITSTVSTSPAPSNFGTGQYSANTPNRVHTPKPFESSKQAPSSKQKSVAQSKPVPKHKSTAKQNSSPKILPSFAPALAKKSVAVSKTVRSSSIITKPLPVSSCRISPTPELNEPPTPNLSPSIPPASHQVQSIVDTLGDTSKSPISGSDLSLSRYPSQQASSTSVVQPPEMAQLPSSLDSNSRNAGEQATVNTNRNEKVAFPSTDKKIPSLMSTSVCYPTKITDFDLSSYSMIGDDHMLDLIGYLQSVDIQVKFNSKFCSTYQTIDTLLSNLQRVPPPKQVVLLVGMYNNLFNQKLLSKYKQLVGFLRKRCSHLVLIEPPPIPRFASMRNSWNTFSELKSSFAPFQMNNVSLVFICKRLLSINNLPDPVFFVSTERLSSAGLSLIAEELKRAILEAKRGNYGLQT